MTDKEIIKALGGPTAIAKKLGYDARNGTCRVCNWERRGIPAKVRLENLYYFMAPTLKAQSQKEKSND